MADSESTGSEMIRCSRRDSGSATKSSTPATAIPVSDSFVSRACQTVERSDVSVTVATVSASTRTGSEIVVRNQLVLSSVAAPDVAPASPCVR